MDNEQRIAEQINRGMTRQQACMTLGIPYTPPAKPASTDKEALRTMAIDTLSTLISDMQTAPSGYKPNEIIAACKEALDRTEGKAAQSMVIDNKTTVTHNYIMQLAPDEAYRQLMDIDIIDMGGGDTVDQAAGLVGCETTPQDTRTLEDYLS